MADLALNPVVAGYNLNLINLNFQAVQDKLNNYILQSKDGKNVLSQDLDMNGHTLLNMSTDFTNDGSMVTVGDAKSHFYQVGLVPAAVADGDAVNLGQVNDLIAETSAADRVTSDAAYYHVGSVPQATADTDAVNYGQVGQMVAAAEMGTVPENVALHSELAADGGSGLVGFNNGVTGGITRTVESKLRERISLLDFIPEAEHAAIQAWTSTYDCSDAIQAAINKARTDRSLLHVPAGTYLVTRTIDAFPSASYAMVGDGPNQSRFAIQLAGAGNIGFKFTNPDGSSTRNKEYVLRDLAFVTTGGLAVGPVLLEHRYITDAKWENLTFTHYQNNSAVVVSDIWNSDFYEISVWGAGHQKPLREVASGVTASIASGSTSLTTSSSIFLSSDIGKYIVVSGPVQHVFKITGFTSGTAITVSPAARSSIVAQQVDFAGVTCFTTSGSNIVTLNAPVLTADDIGRSVYILAAGGPTSDGTGKSPLRGQITAINNPSSMTLSATAGADSTGEFIMFSPGVVLTNDNGGTNDADFKGLHIEEHRGVGLLVDSALNLTLNSVKCHSTPTNKGGANSKTSAANAVFIGTSATVDGDFEQRVGNPYGRIIVSNCSHSGLHFSYISTVATYGMPVIYARDGRYWSKVVIGNVVCQNQADDTYQREWVATDLSTNGINHYGSFSSLLAITNTPGSTAQFGAIKSCGRRPVVQINPGQAASFSLPSDTQCGALLLFSNNNDIGLTCLVGYSYVNGTPQCQILAQPAGGVFASATGALLGQTGTSGKITVSVDSNGVFYVENRASSYRQFWLVNFS